MSREFIWGCELNETDREYVWGDDNFISGGMNFSLLIKEVVLGHEAKNEINVVDLETEGWDLQVIRQPLAILKPIVMQQKSLDILITQRSKFILSKGSGPVYLWGQRVVELSSEKDDLSSVGDESNVLDDDIEDQTIVSPEKIPSKGRAVLNKQILDAKLDSESEKDSSDTDDSDSPLSSKKTKRTSGSRQGKART